MTRHQIRDAAGVALYRHEAVAAVLQVRRVDDAERLCVLVARRDGEPFAGSYALPSGAVEPGRASMRPRSGIWLRRSTWQA
ncbi:NUDIX hydrolase [Tessaracoccus coleopterorum]|uniref:hypothetical protein n=1 Tax=Tessaracoccus coleopterorum TaxID=2714950 RepID=UPI001E2D2985|nr:hypothetical protein [Tessaracoccus coleopterorum]